MVPTSDMPLVWVHNDVAKRLLMFLCAWENHVMASLQGTKGVMAESSQLGLTIEMAYSNKLRVVEHCIKTNVKGFSLSGESMQLCATHFVKRYTDSRDTVTASNYRYTLYDGAHP